MEHIYKGCDLILERTRSRTVIDMYVRYFNHDGLRQLQN